MIDRAALMSTVPQPLMILPAHNELVTTRVRNPDPRTLISGDEVVSMYHEYRDVQFIDRPHMLVEGGRRLVIFKP